MMPSSVNRSIRISGQSWMVAILATTGRFSLSTTALALTDLNVSDASCMKSPPTCCADFFENVRPQSCKRQQTCKCTHRYTLEMAARHAHSNGRNSETDRRCGLRV